jgi:para-nitrobenzyl esterase
VVDGTILPRHPFDPEAPAISKDKPLVVGYNRDETIFFFMESHNTDVFNLTEASLKERLQQEFGDHADARAALKLRRRTCISQSARRG